MRWSAQSHQTFGQLATLRRNNLSFLRFSLAALVIFSHSFPLLEGNNEHEPLFCLTGGRLTAGTLAVAGFFAISGFLITQSWQRSRPVEYCRKRLLRIYPGWVTALLVCLLIVTPISRGGTFLSLSDANVLEFLGQLALHDNGFGLVLPGVFAGNPISGLVDGSTWTIPFEITCYFLIVLFGAAGLLRRRALVLAGTVLLWLWLALLPQSYWPNTGPTPSLTLPYLYRMDTLPLFAGYFLSGACLYLYRSDVPASRTLAWTCGLLLAGVMVWTGQHQDCRLLFLLLPTAGTYALFSIAFASRLRLQNFGQRHDLSYGLYLYGWPIQQLLVQYAGADLTPMALFLLALPLTLCAAALSWRFVEEPCLRLKLL